MTTTPTFWKPKFYVEDFLQDTIRPQGVGLANGNILVVWGDEVGGPSTGHDLLGQFLDPLGNRIGEPIQVNTQFTVTHEDNAKIAAMPDGGFVVAYMTPIIDKLVVERFNAGGQFVAHHVIDDMPFPFVLPEHFDVTVNTDGDYIVAFEREGPDAQSGSDEQLDVHAIVYDGVTNTAGPEHINTAQNNNGNDYDDDLLGAIDTFANGNIICISNEMDDHTFEEPYQSTEIRITSPTGNPVFNFVEIAGSEGHGAIADDVAVLTGGKFVALYHYEEGTSIFAFRIGTVTQSGITFAAETFVAAGAHGPDTQRASVVALQDGGFYIAYIKSNILHGTRYNSNGDVIGVEGLQLTSGEFASSEKYALGQLSLTSDGRILVTFQDASGEIAMVILDPRETVMSGDDADNVLTGQTSASFIFGFGGNDRLFGHDGDDVIQGGLDDDTIYGGGGDDILLGEAGLDVLYGGTRDDNLQGGAGLDVLYGGLGDDNLQGGDDDDQLYGEGGNDRLEGGADLDVLRGGIDDDTYVLNSLHTGTITRAYDPVIENPEEGTDTVQVTPFSGFQAPTSYTLPANVENGVILGTLAFNLIGNGSANALTGNSAANTLNGGGGRDTLTGGSNNDTINGGDGIDTAVFSGTRAQYTLTDLGSGNLQVAGPDGTDTLSSVERLAFNDQTIKWPGSFLNPVADIANFTPGGGGWTSNDTFPRELADVNGDGKVDIVGFGNAGVWVSLATGDGRFAANTFELANFGAQAGGWTSNDSFPRHLADVNGDGNADIVGFGNSGVWVSLATGGGHFAPLTFELGNFGAQAGGWTSNNSFPRELADVNGDGNADIVGFGNGGVWVSLATGNGHFAPVTFELGNFGAQAGGWTNNNSFPRHLADVNGDGNADIVGFGNGGVWVSLATGNGHFAATTFELANFGVQAGGWTSDDSFPRELADVNGDDRADIVGFGNAGTWVSLATGDGHFAPVTFELANFGAQAGGWTNNTTYPRLLGDTDGDGTADIVGFGQNNVWVSLSNFLL